VHVVEWGLFWQAQQIGEAASALNSEKLSFVLFGQLRHPIKLFTGSQLKTLKKT
jgi:hypothetical protein